MLAHLARHKLHHQVGFFAEQLARPAAADQNLDGEDHGEGESHQPGQCGGQQGADAEAH